MGKNSVGQASMEIILAIGFLLLIFIMMVLVAIEKNRESNEIKMFLDAKRICKSVASNINTVSEQGEGYYRHFSIPKEVYGGHNYTIRTYRNFVEISWDKYVWSTQIIASNITILCINVDEGKRNYVFNNGTIYIDCDRPNLLPLIGLRPDNATVDSDVTLSIRITNRGTSSAGNFTIGFEIIGTGIDVESNVSIIHPREILMANATATMPSFPGSYTVRVDVDRYDTINETSESDNSYNESIQIQ